MRLTIFSNLILAAFCFILFSVPAFAQETEEVIQNVSQTENNDLLTTLQAEGQYTILLEAVKKTGLDKTLKTEGPMTLFAPTDEAFQKLPEGTLENLTKEDLTKLLKRHIVMEAITAGNAVTIGAASATSGESVNIEETEDGEVMINNATVLKADIEAGNGIIHSIDTVLEPGK